MSGGDGTWRRDEPSSPCVRVCVVHPEARLCVGCLRTIEEIARWGAMSEGERRAIMAELADRRGRVAQRRGGRAGHLARRG